MRFGARCLNCSANVSFATQRDRDDYAHVHQLKGHIVAYGVSVGHPR